MKGQGMKYFLVNKELDYERGYLEQAEYSRGVLRLLSGADYGAFFSRVFDGGEEELCWHRFVAEGHGPGGASLRMTFYAADSLEIGAGGVTVRIADFLKDSSVPLEEKKRILAPLEKKRALFPKDILLHEVKGRYLFFLAELYAQAGTGPEIEEMTLFFPREDWLRFLPGVYQKEKSGADFTARYLGLFQSFYDDCDRQIRQSSRLLNPADTDEAILKQLGEWFQLEDMYIWPEEKLRLLLKNVPGLFELTGTAQGMREIVRLYTGEEPILIECGGLSDLPGGERYERIYGNDPYRFVLLIRERYLSTARDYQALLCIIRQMKPAHMEARVVPLRQKLVLGSDTYLGINSVLGNYRPLCLDGRSSLTFTSVGNR